MRSMFVAALLAAAAATPALAQTGPSPDGASPFTGFHVDGLVGGNRLQASEAGRHNSVVYGVGGGYDAQTGMGLVGIEAEATDATGKACAGTASAANPRLCANSGRDLYIGGRIGTLVGPRTLVYAKAGYTNLRERTTEDAGLGQFTLDHRNLNGGRVGAGAEYAVGPNSFIKTEYRYSNYQDGVSQHQLLAGFGFRFR